MANSDLLDLGVRHRGNLLCSYLKSRKQQKQGVDVSN